MVPLDEKAKPENLSKTLRVFNKSVVILNRSQRGLSSQKRISRDRQENATPKRLHTTNRHGIIPKH
jgi:hypothetical protein